MLQSGWKVKILQHAERLILGEMGGACYNRAGLSDADRLPPVP
jgi:hypothetical protein